MKSLLWLIGGLAAALAYVVITSSKPAAATPAPDPVVDLAHKLQDAWADHHTVV